MFVELSGGDYTTRFNRVIDDVSVFSSRRNGAEKNFQKCKCGVKWVSKQQGGLFQSAAKVVKDTFATDGTASKPVMRQSVIRQEISEDTDHLSDL